jgi:hypothetical protein
LFLDSKITLEIRYTISETISNENFTDSEDTDFTSYSLESLANLISLHFKTPISVQTDNGPVPVITTYKDVILIK